MDMKWEPNNNFELLNITSESKEETVSLWVCEIYCDGEVCDESINESDGDSADDGAGAWVLVLMVTLLLRLQCWRWRC